jgi:hypothetical protein
MLTLVKGELLELSINYAIHPCDQGIIRNATIYYR